MTGKPGRKAFRGMAPKPFRIRTMEPGEAGRLHAIARDARRRAGGPTAPGDPPSLAAFVEFLVANDVFVVVRKDDGRVAGFAAARDAGDLYWLHELAVDGAESDPQALAAALLNATMERARWFFHRAIGVAPPLPLDSATRFYERHGFMAVAETDLTPPLAALLAENSTGNSAARQVMVRWL